MLQETHPLRIIHAKEVQDTPQRRSPHHYGPEVQHTLFLVWQAANRICAAGTLLKQQIPIRTFQEWKETQPGFLEGDLVAHCGADIEGGYLCTLTLIDVATGWRECLPLLYRSQETVLAAFQRARTLFPFPILGMDTDDGGEFINEAVLAYCAQEHISFTRGRPHLKNDQCFVEQKNGAIVRKARRL